MHRPGVLPMQALHDLIRYRTIVADPAHVNPASIDLSVSDRIFKAKATTLPCRGETIGCMFDRAGVVPHEDPILQPGEIYFVRLNESFNSAHMGLVGHCSPKSTTGRNDVHVRVIAEGVYKYDTIPEDYQGDLWALLIPRSYPVIISRNERVAQVRMFSGETTLSKSDFLQSHVDAPHVFRYGEPVHHSKLLWHKGAIALTLNMHGGVVGFVAKTDITEPVDFRRRDYPVEQFFEPVYSNGHTVHLERNRFYILNTAEALRVPPHLAAEFSPIESDFLEARVHYAGFFDPGWGSGRSGEGCGATAVLEVRTFDDTMVVAGQAVACVEFERMQEEPTEHYGLVGTYVAQHGPRVAKQFMM